MCGIFAVCSHAENAANMAVSGLKKLEYRGYDSWGISYQDHQNTEIHIEKNIGKISEVEENFPKSSQSIGHTRWATHGKVTKKNAHPHQSGKVTIVHNGIIENHQNIKKQKFSRKKFASETDTEVFAAIIEDLMTQGNSPIEALKKAHQQIEGRYAIVMMIEGYDGIYGVRSGSPLIIGRDKGQNFIASDITAFLEYTNTVNYLDDEECVHITDKKVEFYNLQTGAKENKRSIEVDWKNESVDKGDFPHFMIKEIFEQKSTLHNIIDQDIQPIEEAIKILKKSRNIYFVGCGTAHKMCIGGKYAFAQIAQKDVQVVAASEMNYFTDFVDEKSVIVFLSQSGETADILEVVETAKRKKAKIIALTNVMSSTLARQAEVTIPLLVGVEKAVASTKAATAMLGQLFFIAFAESGQIREGKENLRIAATNINDMLNPRYEKHIQKIAKKISRIEQMFIIGRGELYPLTLESAIKIQEVSYIHAQGFAAGEIKHGPLALIEKDSICLVLGGDTQTISNATELKTRGAKIIGVSEENNTVFDWWIRIPPSITMSSITSMIPIQMLSYYLSIFRGHNPDMPRNLAKSVTVK